MAAQSVVYGDFEGCTFSYRYDDVTGVVDRLSVNNPVRATKTLTVALYGSALYTTPLRSRSWAPGEATNVSVTSWAQTRFEDVRGKAHPFHFLAVSYG